MEVTIFRNIKETSVPFHKDVLDILVRIKDGKTKDLVRKIRLEKDKETRNKLKQDLPAICFSGKFSKRDDGSLIKHSGLICLDFDNFLAMQRCWLRRRSYQLTNIHSQYLFLHRAMDSRYWLRYPITLRNISHSLMPLRITMTASNLIRHPRIYRGYAMSRLTRPFMST